MSDEKPTGLDSPMSSILVPSNGTDTNHNPTPLPDAQEDEAIKEQLRNMSPEEYARREKALLWKMDKKLVPWMTVLFTLSFLDRTNVGTAKLAGLVQDLHMTQAQFNIASTIFFVSYVAGEVPSNLVLKKFRPSRWIPTIVILWAIIQICMGLVHTYGQLVALRFLLGLFECGLFPGISFFLSGWYKRNEASKRISLFFGGAVMAGAFGGILGYGLSKMNGVGGKAGWSWIFIMEGILTLLAGLASPWLVQDWPDQNPKFLTPLERQMVLDRLKADTGLASQGTFHMGVVKRAFMDWKMWTFMFAYIGVAMPIYSQSIFTPTIIASLGKWSTPQSLLLSTPPYVFAFITTMTTAWLSDRTGKRAIFLIFWSFMAVIGYILLITIPLSRPGGLYFAVFLTIGSIAPCIATTIVFAAGNFGNHYKKAVSMGMVFSFGNSGGIVASQVYQSKYAPRFVTAHSVTLGFCAMTCICAIILFFGLRRENARRDAQYGKVVDPDTPSITSAENIADEKTGEVVTRGRVTSWQQDLEDREYLERWGLTGMTKEQIIDLGDDHPSFRFMY
ncbi:hypothetical protein NliqN6_4591 [Naganishia liquefaciens]|uniref:Major facilitator superfamily (MFS) profile domain-containing protein n=1 Tax=Naganishia liquefaciens TaxID=104408 RepID=A0A8H3TXX0_9TREE|nr:hypothetical protein NliqN6_4591 [Naganishia liquefaciens]